MNVKDKRQKSFHSDLPTYTEEDRKLYRKLRKSQHKKNEKKVLNDIIGIPSDRIGFEIQVRNERDLKIEIEKETGSYIGTGTASRLVHSNWYRMVCIDLSKKSYEEVRPFGHSCDGESAEILAIFERNLTKRMYRTYNYRSKFYLEKRLYLYVKKRAKENLQTIREVIEEVILE